MGMCLVVNLFRRAGFLCYAKRQGRFPTPALYYYKDLKSDIYFN